MSEGVPGAPFPSEAKERHLGKKPKASKKKPKKTQKTKNPQNKQTNQPTQKTQQHKIPFPERRAIFHMFRVARPGRWVSPAVSIAQCHYRALFYWGSEI